VNRHRWHCYQALRHTVSYSDLWGPRILPRIGLCCTIGKTPSGWCPSEECKCPTPWHLWSISQRRCGSWGFSSSQFLSITAKHLRHVHWDHWLLFAAISTEKLKEWPLRLFLYAYGTDQTLSKALQAVSFDHSRASAGCHPVPMGTRHQHESWRTRARLGSRWHWCSNHCPGGLTR